MIDCISKHSNQQKPLANFETAQVVKIQSARIPQDMKQEKINNLRVNDKKIMLSIDGGGIRGIIALQFLKNIESFARKISNNEDLKLNQCFDYVAGTSTGGIIAACIAVGKTVAEIEKMYFESAKEMFKRRGFGKSILLSLYKSEGLENKLKEMFGSDTNLGSEKLGTLLMLVMHNADTTSPWPISSNPAAKYNDESPLSNLNFKLWQLVRASAAAPLFFEPEVINIGHKNYRFLDGGITPYNNPAFKLFQMATLPEYKLNWKTGADNMLLVSIGTGLMQKSSSALHIGSSAKNVIYALMSTSSAEQDLLCRSFGKVLAGEKIDSEVGDRINKLAIGGKSLYSYIRYNADLDSERLNKKGFSFNKKISFQLDDLNSMAACQRVGQHYAELAFREDHFENFWNQKKPN